MENYQEAAWKMDKFMYDEADMDEYYAILRGEDELGDKIPEEDQLDAMCEFLENNVADEERMYSYFPEDGSVEEFAKYLIEKYNEN
jgi:hypothetical protein